MSKTAQDFGSHWNRPASRVRTEESAETTCDSEDDYLGFRLVHEDTLRVFRGGSWNDGPRLARVSDRNSDGPVGRDDYLGFRLVADWREE